jgi:uncharacterized protein (TIGR00288 family)
MPAPAPASDAQTRIAVFVDFENLALGFRDSKGTFDVRRVLDRLLEKGRVIVKVAYADWNRFREYTQDLHENGIELIEIPRRATTGKNSADIRLVVDAMDLAWSKEHIDTFVIVSGDSDFSPLVAKLKENGKRVIGLGMRASTSPLLANGCDEFIYYEDLVHPPRSRTPEARPARGPDEAFGLLAETVRALEREGFEVIQASLVKDTLKRKRPAFSEAALGFGSFSDLLEAAQEAGAISLRRDERSGTYTVTAPAAPDRSRRRSRASRAGTALVLLALALSAAPSSAFEVFRHSNLTAEVLGRQGVSGNALSLILQGVRWPDITQCVSGCYCPAYVQIFCSDPDSNQVRQFSVSHFDNNMLLESREHVELLMTLARSGLDGAAPPTNEVERRSVGVALMFFGEALHAIQDFYAHSTWVELNRDLIRIGGHIDSAPLWNGESTAGSGSADVGGTPVSGTQTGFVDLPLPAGSVTHDDLNKDAPGTPQGQIVVNRLFPAGRIGTYYEIVSGQVGGSFNAYQDVGLAPRHTIKAWQCLQAGCAIYDLPPGPASAERPGAGLAAAGRRAGGATGLATLDLPSLIAWVNADSAMGAAAQRIDSLWASSNPDSPSTFPLDAFDADGWPLPPSASIADLVRPVARVLGGARPNPFRGRTAIRFRAPRAGHVRLEVFDLAGRRVHTLLDREVEPGWKEVWWSGHDVGGVALASGAYVCRLRGFDHSESCRLVLAR